MCPGAPQPGLGHPFVAAGPARLSSGSRGPLPLLLLSVGFLGGREEVIFPDLLPWPGRGSFTSLHLAPPQLRGALERVAGPSGAAGGTRRVHAGARQSPQAPRSVPGLRPLPGLRPRAGGGGALRVPMVVAGDRLLSHSASRASPVLVPHQPRDVGHRRLQLGHPGSRHALVTLVTFTPARPLMVRRGHWPLLSGTLSASVGGNIPRRQSGPFF